MIEVTAWNYNRLTFKTLAIVLPLLPYFLYFNAIQLINNLLLQQNVRYELLMNVNMWCFL